MKNLNYNNITIKTFAGLEGLVAKEIKLLGAENVVELKRAVTCTADKALVYKMNLHLRTALKVLIDIHKFRVDSAQRLYKKVQEINWSEILTPQMTFAIDSTVNKAPAFDSTNFVSLKAKDAIVDQIRNKHQIRPSVDSENPDLRIHVHISGEDCDISLDSSGMSLHRRGYRISGGGAPLNEALAAGMIMLTGWTGEKDFVNPMCGSGTMLIEAAMIAGNIAPGINRKFGFMRWRDFDKDLWKGIFKEALANKKEIECKIIGSDISAESIDLAILNIDKCRLTDDIIISRRDFFESKPMDKPALIIINPPYNLRLEIDNIDQIYKQIGDTLKNKFNQSEAWIISGNQLAIKQVGLKYSQKIKLFNGPLECTYRKYELY
jgi:putative N6-adenine-specific DNA methylase